MSHTTENLHDVAGVTVGQPTLSSNKEVRYQTVRIHFTDGSTHDITAFLSPGATAFPLRAGFPTVPREPRTLGELMDDPRSEKP